MAYVYIIIRINENLSVFFAALTKKNTKTEERSIFKFPQIDWEWKKYTRQFVYMNFFFLDKRRIGQCSTKKLVGIKYTHRYLLNQKKQQLILTLVCYISASNDEILLFLDSLVYSYNWIRFPFDTVNRFSSAQLFLIYNDPTVQISYLLDIWDISDTPATSYRNWWMTNESLTQYLNWEKHAYSQCCE